MDYPQLSHTLLLASLLIAAPVAAAPKELPQAEGSLPQPAAGWASRNSNEQAEKTARSFLDMLVLDGSIRTPILLETAELAKKDPRQAMENYLQFFLKRLENREYNGLNEVLTGGGKPPDWDQVQKPADLLMKGYVNLDNKSIHIGEPGQVNWKAPWDTNKVYPAQVSLHTAGAFSNLARAYLLTNDRKYLDRWLAYLDDWSLNDDYYRTLHPLDTPDHLNSDSGGVILNTLRMLSDASAPARRDKVEIPPRILAQVFRRFLLEELPYTVTYIRSNTHNWTPGTRLLKIALAFQDFKAAQFYFREGLRRNVEDNAVTQNLRDGTENQQDHWYNAYYLDLSAVFDLLKVDSSLPGWGELKRDYEWRDRMARHFTERATYLIHDRSPQNNLPIAWSGGYNRNPETGDFDEAPEAFKNATNQEILKAVNGNAQADPGFDSEWFPYGGYNIVRAGWDRNSAYGAMFCSPAPGAYGGYRSRSNNNTFGLSAYGQDLLIDDATGHYMYPTSPLRVDGMNQFFHVGIYKVEAPQNHKVFQVNAWQHPAPWRWHASAKFNLMEGDYRGAYARPGDPNRVEGPYGTDESLSGTLPAGSGINDVEHQRLVLFVREAGLWIIDDRLRSPGTHEYAQQWLLPIRPEDGTPAKEIRSGPAFSPAKITLDEAGKKISTNEPTVPVPRDGKIGEAKKANLSLYQFTSARLSYSADPKPRGKEYGYYLYPGWDRVQSKWQGTGNQQVVTVAFPRAPGTGPEGDLKSSKTLAAGKDATGFEAQTPGGQTVKYLSTPDGAGMLTLDNVSVQGEALLLADNGGLALGVKSMTIGGKTVTPPAQDFEFTLNGAGTPSFTPIYRPIEPVDILPGSDVFDTQAKVTLKCTTPGVEIRYTLDGQEPTPQSALYSTPFLVTRDTTVLARAYRPGVTENPVQQSGTLASPVSSARFEKHVAAPAVNPTRPNTGLNVSYYEGPWQDLLLGLPDDKPLAQKKGVNLWDTSVIPAGNPPLGGNAGSRTKPYEVEYSGFLNVPQSGVYTLYAPFEYVWPSEDAGYELNVWLGNQYGRGVFSNRVVGQNRWYPSTRYHGLGTWSVVLEKGLHPFRVSWADYRTDGPQRLNKPKFTKFIWDGTTPDLKISGPGMEPQAIPASWFMRPMDRP